jgi:hypothetical protein
MSRSEFEAFVKRQQTEQQEEAIFDPKQQLEQWLGYLGAGEAVSWRGKSR